MATKLLFVVSLMWITCTTTPPRLNIIPSITTVINRITNNTIGVLQGVQGVVQGSLFMLSSTINGIFDGTGTTGDKIIRLFEEFRKYMQKGIPELGIPILEPLIINKIEVNITSPNLGKFSGQAANVQIRRLSEFKLDYVTWNLKNKLLLNITFPRIDVKGKYIVSGKISKMIEIFGQGPFWLKLGGLSIGAVIQMNFNRTHDPPYHVQSMKIGILLKKLNSKFSNLMNDEHLANLFNEVISNIAPTALDMLWPDIEPGISRQIVNIINEKLKIFPLRSIIGRLLNIFNLNQGKIDVHT